MIGMAVGIMSFFVKNFDSERIAVSLMVEFFCNLDKIDM
jgi:hypothetical protein